jgi:hypothetical protein
MKRYIYFNDGRASFDGHIFRFEKLSKFRIPKNHLSYNIGDVDSSIYPQKIMDYLESLLSKEKADILTWYLSQIIGGKIYNPIILIGAPKSGKSVLISLLKDIFNPFLSFKNLNRSEWYINRIALFKNKKFIIESNLDITAKGHVNIYFKNTFDNHYSLDYLKSDFPHFIMYLIYRHADFIYGREA